MVDNRGPEIQAVVIFLLVLCVLTVVLRSYTMKFIVGRFAIEDWLAVLALALYIVFAAFALLSVHHGLGRHLAHVAPAERPVAFMWRHFATIAYIPISALTKFIVGLFLLRLCAHIRWMRAAIWVLLVATGLFYTFYFFIDIFASRPVEYYWLRYAPDPPEDGYVNDVQWATIPTIVGSVLNIVVDWALAILPMILLWNAGLDRRTKVSVCGVLAVGSIASVATIVRLVYANALLDNSEYLYNFTDFGIWSTVEIGLALSASSLATLRPLMHRFRVLSGTEAPVVMTSLRDITNAYGSGKSGEGGGRGAGPEAKVPEGAGGFRGGFERSSVSNVTTREVPEPSFERGGGVAWRDLEEAAGSGIELVSARRT